MLRGGDFINIVTRAIFENVPAINQFLIDEYIDAFVIELEAATGGFEMQEISCKTILLLFFESIVLKIVDFLT